MLKLEINKKIFVLQYMPICTETVVTSLKYLLTFTANNM